MDPGDQQIEDRNYQQTGGAGDEKLNQQEGDPLCNHPHECEDALGDQPVFVAEEMGFLKTFMSLNEEERILIGHNFSSFIKGCTFRGRDCLDET